MEYNTYKYCTIVNKTKMINKKKLHLKNQMEYRKKKENKSKTTKKETTKLYILEKRQNEKWYQVILIDKMRKFEAPNADCISHKKGNRKWLREEMCVLVNDWMEK